MAKGISDVSNFAVRIFLQKMGEAHDKSKGFAPYSKKDFKAVKEYFNNECCFCGNNTIKLTGDHLIPINKTSLGLEAWGNVVPACSECNAQKHSKDWVSFLSNVPGGLNKHRQDKIEAFVAEYQYGPDADAIRIAVEELYEESGAIVLELIRLKTTRALSRSNQTLVERGE